jgi:hypothetical protein
MVSSEWDGEFVDEDFGSALEEDDIFVGSSSCHLVPARAGAVVGVMPVDHIATLYPVCGFEAAFGAFGAGTIFAQFGLLDFVATERAVFFALRVIVPFVGLLLVGVHVCLRGR